MLRIGTDKGLYSLGSGDAEVIVDGHTYEALGGDWAIVDHDRLEHLISDRQYTFDVRAWCVAPFGDDPLVGTANARLFIGSQPVTSFDAIPTRPEWFEFNVNTFQLAASGADVALGTDDGRVYVSADAGGSWSLAAEGLPPIHCLAFAGS